MRFAVHWCEQDAPFDPNNPSFGKTLLARIHLEQSENEPAWAQISCFLPERTPTHVFQAVGSQAYIAYKKNPQEAWQCLIRGYVADPPQIQDGLCLYRLVADHQEAEPHRIAFFQAALSHQDSLWMQDWKHTESCVKQTDSILHIDRCTHHYSLSNLFKGQHLLDLKGRFDPKSFACRTVPTFAGLSVAIEAQWIQKHQGSFAFGPLIRQQAQGPYLQTLTAQALQKVWPKKETRLGRSHLFWVTESRLETKQPSSLFSSESGARKIKSASGAPVMVKKTWLDPVLDIAWDIRQKRIETLSFELKNTLQNIPYPSEVKKVSWDLVPIQLKPEAKPWLSGGYYHVGDCVRDEEGKLYQAIKAQYGEHKWDLEAWSLVPEALAHPDTESFFGTARGRQLVDAAIERANAYLAHHSRGIEIVLQGSFEDLASVTLDHTIQWDCPLLKTQTLHGKVKRYRMVLSEKERVVTLVLGVATGKKEAPLFEKPKPASWLAEGCLEEGCFQPMEACCTPLGKTYLPISPMPQALRFKRMPQAFVKYEAQAQEEMLQQKNTVPVTEIHLDLPVFSQQAALRSRVEAVLTHVYQPPAFWPYESYQPSSLFPLILE